MVYLHQLVDLTVTVYIHQPIKEHPDDENSDLCACLKKAILLEDLDFNVVRWDCIRRRTGYMEIIEFNVEEMRRTVVEK